MILSVTSYTVLIADGVMEIFNRCKQDSPRKPEQGGILLGQVVDNRIYIMRVSTPTAMDKMSRSSFVRDRGAAQVIVNHEFENSNGKTIYLGEWHTHPEDTPSPSSVDIEMIKNQRKRTLANVPFLLMMIVGLGDIYVGLFDGSQIHQASLVSH